MSLYQKLTKAMDDRDVEGYVQLIHEGVRRQVFWDQWRLKLRESLAHLVGLIMRRAGGDASVALRVSFV